MGHLTLLLGGARSGKSTHAEKLAFERGGDDVLYVATAEIKDAEMQQRVEKHRADRPASWQTVEAPRDVARHIRAAMHAQIKAVMVDCITVLIANHLMHATAPPVEDSFGELAGDPFDPALEAAIMAEVRALAQCAQDFPVDMIVVSNEVGMGLVPPYELGRAYRDLLGRANQTLAAAADQAYLLVAGLPLQLK